MVLDREQLPGATEARLHFVAHEQDAVLVADFPDAQHELWRTRHVAAFAEDGLEDHRGDVARSALLAQEQVQLLEAVLDAHAVQLVRKGADLYASREWPEASAIDVLDVVMPIVSALRPWYPPWKTMMFDLPVAWRASLTAFSTASAPVVQK